MVMLPVCTASPFGDSRGPFGGNLGCQRAETVTWMPREPDQRAPLVWLGYATRSLLVPSRTLGPTSPSSFCTAQS